jgi:hypothetical protein
VEAGAVEAAQALKKAEDDKSKSLAISFILMVVIGLGNKIFQVGGWGRWVQGRGGSGRGQEEDEEGLDYCSVPLS